MDTELLAIFLTFFVHVLGAGVLIWNLLDGSSSSWRDWWPRDDRGPEPPAPPTPPTHPVATTSGLPDAAPSPVRLREPGRLGDHKAPPARRPAHPPVPERSPVRERDCA